MIALTCPWCGAQATESEGGVCHEAHCACGAIAFGAPIRDFDEVLDSAIDHFGLSVDIVAVNFGHPSHWLDGAGIDWKAGDALFGTDVAFHWFKRVHPARRLPR